MPNTRVRHFHQQLSEFERRWRDQHPGVRIHCGPACAACCHLAVHCSFPEAMAVAETLDISHVQDLEDYVSRLRASFREQLDLPGYLRRHRCELGPCPFLATERTCRIHGLRPLSCRALLATRPAAWCGIDLRELDPLDKQLFQQSLDVQLVAGPTHYLAATQSLARNQEQQLGTDMQNRCGWTLYGNFPLQVWLEHKYRLSCLEAGQTRALLQDLDLAEIPALDLTEVSS